MGQSVRLVCCRVTSHPSRDAWIEMSLEENVPFTLDCRIPRGMRGLKSHIDSLSRLPPVCRIPRGMRGLKYSQKRPELRSEERRIPRGMRGLKYHVGSLVHHAVMSHPSRDAWIEIYGVNMDHLLHEVASLAGCVD